MSRSTSVTIDANTYQILLADQTRLRAMNVDLPRVLAATREQSLADMRSSLAPLERRQQEFMQGLSGLSDTVREQERRTAERLALQRGELQQRIAQAEQSLHAEIAAGEQRLWEGIVSTSNQLVGMISAEAAERLRQGQEFRALIDIEAEARAHLGQELRARVERERLERAQAILHLQADMTTMIAEERAERERQIAQEAQTRQREIDRLEHQIHDLQAAERARVVWAQEWIANAHHMYDTVAKQEPHERFAPGRLAIMRRTLELAQQNASLAPQGAVAQAQQAYHELSDFRIELQMLEQEWQQWRHAALEQAREVLAMARASRTCSAEDGSGRDLALQMEVDHWTGGELSRLEVELAQLTAQIEDSNSTLTTDQLREIATRRSLDLRKRLDDVIDHGRRAIIASQMRANIAQLAVEALESQGFHLVDTTWGGNDHRKGFAAKVQHLDGREVMVTVDPDPAQVGQNHLRILTFDEASEASPALRMQQAREVSESLAEQGLAASAPTTDNHEVDHRLRDLRAVSAELNHAQPVATPGTAH